MRTSVVVGVAAVIAVVATAAVALSPGGSNPGPQARDGLSDHQGDRKSTTAARKKPARRNGPPGGWPFPPRSAPSCDRKAGDSSELRSQWAAAKPGQTICLSTGDYGTFRAGSKSGVVAVRPQPNALPTMSLDFSGARNVRLEGLTIRGGSLTGDTRNVTLARNRFTSHLQIIGLVHSNVVLARNTHNNIDSQPGEPPGRIHLAYSCSAHSGVTIRNSLLSGGDSDGVQAGCGVNIVNNEFRNIQAGGGANHTDNIQLIDAPGSVVRGNWIHASGETQGLGAYDGLVRATIEDNVVDIRRASGIEIYSDRGSTVRHNTLKYYPPGCFFGEPCGAIDINRKSQDDAGEGTVVVNNVATAVIVQSGSTVAERHHNLVRRYVRRGDRRRVPRFAGGSSPGSYGGFRLAGGSPGERAASDSQDVGIR